MRAIFIEFKNGKQEEKFLDTNDFSNNLPSNFYNTIKLKIKNNEKVFLTGDVSVKDGPKVTKITEHTFRSNPEKFLIGFAESYEGSELLRFDRIEK